MTFSTEVRIISHIADIDIHQVCKLGKFFNTKGLEFNIRYDRLLVDRYLYTVDADITGHSNEFYVLMDEMMK